MTKWTRSIIKKLKQLDIETVRNERMRSGHMKLFIKCVDDKERFLIISSTPSDNRAIQKILSTARILFRG